MENVQEYPPLEFGDTIWNVMTNGTKCSHPECLRLAYHFCDIDYGILGKSLFKGCGKAMCDEHTLLTRKDIYRCSAENCVKKFNTFNRKASFLECMFVIIILVIGIVVSQHFQ